MKKKLITILGGSILLAVIAATTIFEKFDIPRLCAINNISYQTVCYIKQFTPYSKYTIMLSLKNGRESGEDIWVTLDKLDPNLTPKEVNQILNFMEEEASNVIHD